MYFFMKLNFLKSLFNKKPQKDFDNSRRDFLKRTAIYGTVASLSSLSNITNASTNNFSNEYNYFSDIKEYVEVRNENFDENGVKKNSSLLKSVEIYGKQYREKINSKDLNIELNVDFIKEKINESFVEFMNIFEKNENIYNNFIQIIENNYSENQNKISFIRKIYCENFFILLIVQYLLTEKLYEKNNSVQNNLEVQIFYLNSLLENIKNFRKYLNKNESNEEFSPNLFRKSSIGLLSKNYVDYSLWEILIFYFKLNLIINLEEIEKLKKYEDISFHFFIYFKIINNTDLKFSCIYIDKFLKILSQTIKNKSTIENYYFYKFDHNKNKYVKTSVYINKEFENIINTFEKLLKIKKFSQKEVFILLDFFFNKFELVQKFGFDFFKNLILEYNIINLSRFEEEHFIHFQNNLISKKKEKIMLIFFPFYDHNRAFDKIENILSIPTDMYKYYFYEIKNQVEFCSFLNKFEDNSIDLIYLNGHGNKNGIQLDLNETLDIYDRREIELIHKKIKKNSQIVFRACSIDSDFDNDMVSLYRRELRDKNAEIFGASFDTIGTQIIYSKDGRVDKVIFKEYKPE